MLSAAVCAVLLAACGGGGGSGEPSGPVGAPTTPGNFSRVVVFGDSLSDLGTYAPATSIAGDGTAPYFGGRFTTNAYSGYTADNNTSTALVWPEWVATELGLIITPNQVGFAGQSVFCPAAAVPALASTCTGYAQGGARVTDPNGIGKTEGALTVPLVTQVANHREQFGNFTASDLVFVYGGSNDVLMAYENYHAVAAALREQVATGEIPPENLALLLDQLRLGALLTVGAGYPGTPGVASQLAALIKNEIIAKGGRYVAVMNLPDIALTPFGRAQPSSLEGQTLLRELSVAFNEALYAALDGVPVVLIDARTVVADTVANPGNYGLVNADTPACDPDKISTMTGGRVTDGSALFCNSTPGAPFNGLRDDADVTTWLFADGVHPTTIGHSIFAAAVLDSLVTFNWIAAP